jgi:hypothetical protein
MLEEAVGAAALGDFGISHAAVFARFHDCGAVKIGVVVLAFDLDWKVGAIVNVEVENVGCHDGVVLAG